MVRHSSSLPEAAKHFSRPQVSINPLWKLKTCASVTICTCSHLRSTVRVRNAGVANPPERSVIPMPEIMVDFDRAHMGHVKSSLTFTIGRNDGCHSRRHTSLGTKISNVHSCTTPAYTTFRQKGSQIYSFPTLLFPIHTTGTPQSANPKSPSPPLPCAASWL